MLSDAASDSHFVRSNGVFTAVSELTLHLSHSCVITNIGYRFPGKLEVVVSSQFRRLMITRDLKLM